MNVLLNLVVFALCSPSVLPLQETFKADPGSSRLPQTSEQGRLRLTTEIVKMEYYCGNRLSLDLRLTFTNIGQVPVILSKRSLGIAAFRVSRNLESVAASRYEEQGTYEDFGDNAIFELPVVTDFVIIRPGEKYETQSDRTRVHLDVASANSTNALLAGDHVLEVVVGTWLYIAVDEHSRPHIQDEQFREKWKDKGFLWSDALTSVAMPFRVNRASSKKCSH
jgi:hypothetical protein